MQLILNLFETQALPKVQWGPEAVVNISPGSRVCIQYWPGQLSADIPAAKLSIELIHAADSDPTDAMSSLTVTHSPDLPDLGRIPVDLARPRLDALFSEVVSAHAKIRLHHATDRLHEALLVLGVPEAQLHTDTSLFLLHNFFYCLAAIFTIAYYRHIFLDSET
jgi:hypothetical protein